MEEREVIDQRHNWEQEALTALAKAAKSCGKWQKGEPLILTCERHELCVIERDLYKLIQSIKKSEEQNPNCYNEAWNPQTIWENR